MTITKKIPSTFIFVFFCLTLIFIFCQQAYGQELSDERSEQALERVTTPPLTPMERTYREKALRGRWRQNIKMSYGYSTNPQLSTSRQSDQYQSTRYSLSFNKTFMEKNQFSFLFDLSQEHYNRLEALNSSIGHLRFDYKRALSKNYIFAFGFDESFSYFSSNEDAIFNFHKLYTQFEHRPTKNFFHQLEYEFGWKIFEQAKARGPTTEAIQDNVRKDIREAFGYSLGYTFTDRFSSRLTYKSAYNNSNAQFEDYHDYHTHEIGPRLHFQLTNNLSMNGNYSFKFKEYTARTVSTGISIQEDRIYQAGLGFNYKFRKRHQFNLDYTYRQNDSNDAVSHYTASQIEGGWQFNF